MKKFFLSVSLFLSISLIGNVYGGPIGGGPIGNGPIGIGGGGDGIFQLFKTGQTTSYHAGDAGDLDIGEAQIFTVLTTEQYSGTTDVTINSKTYTWSNECVGSNSGLMFIRYVPQTDIGPATDGKLFWEQYTITGESVTFNVVAKTITAAVGNPFDTGALCAGRIFTVSGTVNNNGIYTVAVIAGNVITTSEALVNEGPVATDFATVDDLIWDLRDQANANSLAGYTDWRLPNVKELESIADFGQVSPATDTTTFPSTPSDSIWTSSTVHGTAANAWTVRFDKGFVWYANKKKEVKYCVRLVRN